MIADDSAKLQRLSGVMPLKIDIVVHGRFHAFSLAHALMGLGHDVRVHTNYPKFVAARWGLPPSSVNSFFRHGVTTRLADRISARAVMEPYLHRAFGAWAAKQLRTDADLVYGFSGVFEETLSLPRISGRQARILVRGSSHIREQARLLEQEAGRVGMELDRPSAWMIAREEREYALADRISVLSDFALQSFLRFGFSADQVFSNRLGVNLSRFRVSPEVKAARIRRIRSGAPLNVLTVGTFSFRKGMLDLSSVAARLGHRMRFRFVGDLPPETRALRRQIGTTIEIIDRVPESALINFYNEADLFLFPTIEDGFAAVLVQAAAAGLPILATSHCGAPDFVESGSTGWILPIRDPEAFISRLSWCDANRNELAAMVLMLDAEKFDNSWADMAKTLVKEASPEFAKSCAK